MKKYMFCLFELMTVCIPEYIVEVVVYVGLLRSIIGCVYNAAYSIAINTSVDAVPQGQFNMCYCYINVLLTIRFHHNIIIL